MGAIEEAQRGKQLSEKEAAVVALRKERTALLSSLRHEQPPAIGRARPAASSARTRRTTASIPSMSVPRRSKLRPHRWL